MPLTRQISMNEYFTSIEPDLAAKVPVIDIEPESYVDSSESAFVFKSINIDEVYNVLNNLKTSKSLGPDRIPARLLKDSCFSIAPFLTQIFNASLASSVIPQDWKIARVSPISIKWVISKIVITIPTNYIGIIICRMIIWENYLSTTKWIFDWK